MHRGFGFSMFAGSNWALVGVGFVAESSLLFAAATRISRLAPITARDYPLPALSGGVLTTGRAGRDVAPRHGWLVPFEEDRLEDPGGSRSGSLWPWERRAEQDPQPSFPLRRNEGVIPDLGANSSLDNLPQLVRLEYHRSRGQHAGGRSSRRFKRGETVTVRGSVASDRERQALRVEAVAGDTREEILRRDRVAALLYRTVGIFALLIGIGQAGGFRRHRTRSATPSGQG